MPSAVARFERSRRRVARWRRVLLTALGSAAALIVAVVAALLLAEIPALGVNRAALRAQVLWPVLPALTVLLTVAASAVLRLVQLVPIRALFRVRESVCFAAACATLVLLPSAILLSRWADVSGLESAYRLIQLLEYLEVSLTLVLLLRAAGELWYADCERGAA
jgi:hypothetical protein